MVIFGILNRTVGDLLIFAIRHKLCRRFLIAPLQRATAHPLTGFRRETITSIGLFLFLLGSDFGCPFNNFLLIFD